MSIPKGTYRLVTVNNVPERAKKVMGRVAEELKDRYTIDYGAHCLSESRPGILRMSIGSDDKI
jgi:hypothetical protein